METQLPSRLLRREMLSEALEELRAAMVGRRTGAVESISGALVGRGAKPAEWFLHRETPVTLKASLP